jgi:two-component system, chemotaxis family, chemotaxis protein CheY
MRKSNAAVPIAWEEPIRDLGRAPANGRSVLLVEDDLDVRETLAEVLTMEGHVVATARDGVEALQVARQRPPDLILLDLMMPRMTGWEFRAVQRVDPVLSSIPVVVVSACSHELAAELDATAYLPKPFDLDKLLALVDRISGSPRKPPKSWARACHSTRPCSLLRQAIEAGHGEEDSAPSRSSSPAGEGEAATR